MTGTITWKISCFYCHEILHKEISFWFRCQTTHCMLNTKLDGTHDLGCLDLHVKVMFLLLTNTTIMYVSKLYSPEQHNKIVYLFVCNFSTNTNTPMSNLPFSFWLVAWNASWCLGPAWCICCCCCHLNTGNVMRISQENLQHIPPIFLKKKFSKKLKYFSMLYSSVIQIKTDSVQMLWFLLNMDVSDISVIFLSHYCVLFPYVTSAQFWTKSYGPLNHNVTRWTYKLLSFFLHTVIHMASNASPMKRFLTLLFLHC